MRAVLPVLALAGCVESGGGAWTLSPPLVAGDADTAAPDLVEPCPALPVTAPGATVIYATRHAEKESDGDDPALTEDGLARAQALVDVMRAVPLVAVYATDLVRTQQTVQPTADDHGLPVQIALDPEEELAAHVLATHAGASVLHAGHSYTVPPFLEALGVADAPFVSGYGQLWVVSVLDGDVTIVESCFGA